MNKEPAVVTTVILGLITAAIGLITAFSVNVSQEQAGAITGFAGAVLAVVFGLFIRAKVTPVGPVPPSHPEV